MSTAQNHLIDLLPKPERARLLALCESVPLLLSHSLGERGEATRHVYFPVDGFVSLVAQVDDHHGVEVAMVGREGMVGTQLVLGVSTVPLRALVQRPGTAWRIGRVDFRRELARSAALKRGLDRYLHVLGAQVAASVACLHYHQIGPRMARWLLMSQDRAHADSFHVTQELLARLLGVRRVGVTVAAGGMARRHLIAYRRGELTVLDRAGLEAAACTCYAIDRETYRAQLGERAAPGPAKT